MAPDETAAVAELVVGAYAGDFPLSEGYRAEIAAVADRAEAHEVWVAVDAADRALLGTVSTPRPGRAISQLARDGEPTSASSEWRTPPAVAAWASGSWSTCWRSRRPAASAGWC